MTTKVKNFSFHDMENIKRSMANLDNVSHKGHLRSATSGSEEMSFVPPQAAFSQDMPGAGETMRFRRGFRILRRHFLPIIFLTLLLPSMIWMLDTYVRKKVYIAKVNYEQFAEAKSRNIIIGMTRLYAKGAKENNIKNLLQYRNFDYELRKLIFEEVSRLGEEAEVNSDFKKTQQLKQLIKKLKVMVGIPGKKPPPEYLKFRGEIMPKILDKNHIEVTVSGSEPEVQQVVADLMVHALNKISGANLIKQITDFQLQLQGNWQENTKQREIIRRQIADINEQVKGKDIELGNSFKITDQLQLEKHKAQMELAGLQFKLQYLEEEAAWSETRKRFKMAGYKDIKQVLVKTNPLRRKWRKLRAESQEMLTRYTVNHPRLQKVQHEIDAVIAQLKSSGNLTSLGVVPPLPNRNEEEMFLKIQQLQQKLLLANLTLKTINKELNTTQGRYTANSSKIKNPRLQQWLSKLSGKRASLEQQQKIFKENSLQLYKHLGEVEMLLSQVKKERKFSQQRAAQVSLVSPKITLDMSLALVSGLVVSCAVAFVLEGVDTRLHTPFDIYYQVGLNCLGVVPSWRKHETNSIIPEKANTQISDIYAALRTNIRYGRSGTPESCLLVTSATQNEGKSTVSSNLAISFAQEGNNVILIDADMRRPSIHKFLKNYLGEDESKIKHGLSDYLQGNVNLPDIIKKTTLSGLAMIPGGNRVQNPARLAGSAEMKDMLDKIEKNFDIIIIDSPAVLPVVDATTISGYVRGVLLVVAGEDVEVAAVRMALYRLQHVDSPIVGAVLNKVKSRTTSSDFYGYHQPDYYSYNSYATTNTIENNKEMS